MNRFASALFRWKRALRIFGRPGRRALFLLGVAGLGIGLAGCAQNEAPADFVIINGAEPESLDPQLVTGQPDGRVAGALFEGLCRFDPVTADPIPGIADRWEVSPDGKTYLFHIRTNAVWSTGEPITAHDVVFSWIRARRPETAADYAGQLFYIQNGEDFNAGRITDPDQVGVHALDERTLRVDLVGPTPFFPDLCAFRTLAVLHPATIKKHGDKWLMARPLPTSGAYELEYWRVNDRIRLRKNPRYWDAAHTRNEVIDILSTDSAYAALNLFETRQADIIWDKALIPTELLDVLRQKSYCHMFDYLGTYFFRYNVTEPPFDDVRVRKALAMAVDKQRIVDRLTRAGEKTATHLTPKGMGNYHPPEGVPYDPEGARRLLAEAGYRGGHGFPRFQYMFNTSRQHEQIAIEMQAMWRNELGIEMELRQVEWKVYLSEQSKTNYHTCRSSWIGDYKDPNTFLDMFMSNNGNNRTGWGNERYDTLLRQANQTTDRAKRAELLREAETILVRDDLPIVPLFFYTGIAFYRPEEIGGIHLDSNLLDEHPMNAIYRKPKKPGLEPGSRAAR